MERAPEAAPDPRDSQRGGWQVEADFIAAIRGERPVTHTDFSTASATCNSPRPSPAARGTRSRSRSPYANSQTRAYNSARSVDHRSVSPFAPAKGRPAIRQLSI